jgi:hypothetical protein
MNDLVQKKSPRGRKSNASKGLEVRKPCKVYLTETEQKALIKKHGSLQLAINKLLID